MLMNRTITARETLAMKELGADHVTILAGPLEDMLNATQLPPPTKGQQWQKRLSELGKPNLTWAKWDVPEPTASEERMKKLVSSDPLDKTMNKDWKMASTEINYLEGKTLDEYNEKDEVTKIRLRDALEVFTAAETETREEIERLKKEL
jgi:transaldolase